MARSKQPRSGVRRGRSAWTVAVAEWRASGLSTAEFCGRRGLVPSTFCWWRWRLSQDGEVELSAAPVASLLPVRVVGAGVMTEDEPRRTVSAEPVLELIHPRGVRLRVPSGFDERTVAGVLWALEAVGSC